MRYKLELDMVDICDDFYHDLNCSLCYCKVCPACSRGRMYNKIDNKFVPLENFHYNNFIYDSYLFCMHRYCDYCYEKIDFLDRINNND